MALKDITYVINEERNFILELPQTSFSGSLKDELAASGANEKDARGLITELKIASSGGGANYFAYIG